MLQHPNMSLWPGVAEEQRVEHQHQSGRRHIRGLSQAQREGLQTNIPGI